MKKPKLPPMVSLWQDWYFQRGYSESDKDALTDDASDAVDAWFKESYAKIATIFANQPDKKSAAEIYMVVCQRNDEPVLMAGEAVCLLMFLLCGRDRIEPSQCLVYLGRKSFIEQIREDLMAQMNQQLSRPGVEADIIEEDLANSRYKWH
jgi:hypothetical protein